ncbi:hypothetical protein CPC08DRAFT_727339 [Agrocybe pediades]|nr:hypothetical protein CPC08DRAFT_727339 [Agrocybe pediades]
MGKHKNRIQKLKGKERSRQRQAREAAAAAVPPLPDDILRTIFLLNASDADVPTRLRRKITTTCLFVCRLWYNILMDHGQVWGRLLLLEACVKKSITSHAVSETKKRAKGSNLWVEVDDTSLLESATNFENLSPPLLFDDIRLFDNDRIEKIVIKYGNSFVKEETASVEITVVCAAGGELFALQMVQRDNIQRHAAAAIKRLSDSCTLPFRVQLFAFSIVANQHSRPVHHSLRGCINHNIV